MDKDRSKVSIYLKVENLAKQFNIPKSMVRDIISEYVAYCKKLIKHGIRVDFVGLVAIEPSTEQGTYSITNAYICHKIADALSLTLNTVQTVVQTYLDGIVEEIMNERCAEIRGLVTIKVLDDVVHSYISSTLKDDLNPNVESVRVHTSRFLRQKLKLSKGGGADDW